MVAKSFCDKYVPLLLHVLVGEERNCISADDVIAVSHFLYCIQSPYLLGIECPSTSNLSTDSHRKVLENRIFSLIDGINDSNPLKEVFFADPSVDPTAARYLYSPVCRRNCNYVFHKRITRPCFRTCALMCANLFSVAGKLKSFKWNWRRLILPSNISATRRMFWSEDVGLLAVWSSLQPRQCLRPSPQFCCVQRFLPRWSMFLNLCKGSGAYLFPECCCLSSEALNSKDLCQIWRKH